MSLKENFLQAARELMSGAPEPAMAYSSVSAAAPECRTTLIKEASIFSPRRENENSREVSVEHRDAYESAAPIPAEPAGSTPLSSVREPARQPAESERDARRTVLADGTVVHGSISSSGSLELHGEVYGDILSQEDITLTGKLEGNASGRNIDLRGGRVKGNIQASGRVRVDSDSIILGNIRAGTLLLNGRVKGSLDIKEAVALDVSAAVAGNVTAGKLSIAEGAMLQGEVRISSADLNKLFAGEPGPAATPRERPFTPPVHKPEPKAPPVPETAPEAVVPPEPEAPPERKSEAKAEVKSESKPELKPDFVALLNKLSADKTTAEPSAPEADKPE